MHLTVSVTVPMRSPMPVDVAVRTDSGTAADLATALGDLLGVPDRTLLANGILLDPEHPIGRHPLLHGAALVLAGMPSARHPESPTAPVDLAVIGGPDCGRRLPVTAGSLAIGRESPRGLRIEDRRLSRLHAELRATAEGLVLVDLASTNGTVVDGAAVPAGGTPITTYSRVVLGGTTMVLRSAAAPSCPGAPGSNGRITVPARRTPLPRRRSTVIDHPEPPAAERAAAFPWIAALAPLALGAVLAAFWGPQVLVFALLGPVVAVASSLSERTSARRRHRRALAEYSAAASELARTLDEITSDERAEVEAQLPDPVAVIDIAESRAPGLWSRPDTDCGLGVVRLGHGTRASARVGVRRGSSSEVECPAITNAPFAVDLLSTRGLLVYDAPEVFDGIARSVLGQLVTLSPPHRLAVGVVLPNPPGDPSGGDSGLPPSQVLPPQWSWLRWLPHFVGAFGSAADVLATGRLTVDAEGTVVVLDPYAVVSSPDQAAPGILLGRQQSAGRASVPVLVPQGLSSDHALTAPDGATTAVTTDRVGLWWAERVARSLAPLVDESALSGGRLPATALSDLVPAQPPGAWTQGPRLGCVATIGMGREGPLSIDLDRHGPHLLVGGTTGSGKSEFLRTLVMSLALRHPPSEVSFVLVDYKGGAAFGPAAALPHTVGTVTDLDEHLAERALVSLRAEVTRRERLLAEVGARDHGEYGRLRGSREALPRLVIVIDEFRVLVDELPEFVSGVVSLAAVGRSLGIHLVLATQRPAGVVSADIAANVNGRICFRVRDEADSRDVIESTEAAHLPPAAPGSALMRVGGGELIRFRAALVTAPADEVVGVHVSLLRDPLSGEGGALAAQDTSGSEMERLAGIIQRAAADLALPPLRQPWLPPLPAHLTQTEAHTLARAELDLSPETETLPDDPRGLHEAPPVEGIIWGLIDQPAQQSQTPLTWTREDRLTLVVGSSGSGRTTAARSLAVAAAERFSPTDLPIYWVGSGTDPALDLPHVAGTIRADDPRALTALTRLLRTHQTRALVIVDGLDRLVGGRTSLEWATVAEPLIAVLRSGSGSVHAIVTGDRSLVHGAVGDAAATTLALGVGGTHDAAYLGLPPSAVPSACTPGRGVRLGDAAEVQVAVAELSDIAAVQSRWHGRSVQAPRICPIPDRVSGLDLPHEPPGAGWLGRGGTDARPVPWQPEESGYAVLVTGPPRSGRSSAAALLTCLRGGTSPVVVIGSRVPPGIPDAVILGPDDAERLAVLKEEHRSLTVIVEDGVRVDGTPLEAVVRGLIAVADRDRALTVVVASSAALATGFRGVAAELAAACAARGSGALLLWPSVERGAAEVLRLRDIEGIPSVPGRAAALIDGECTEVQLIDPGSPREAHHHCESSLASMPRR